MNCATHSDTAAVAFCRTCGKPLCNQCTRDVRGVIYCEACLAARMEGTAPAAGFTPVQPPPQTGYQQVMDQGLGLKVPPGPSSGPNPAVAGILSGFFPIGVGAVYTGQYAKGLVHLGIAVLMIIVVSSDVPWYVKLILAISMGFFYVYQIIDSVRTARAIQSGEPAPDPFGLAQMFGTGDRFETTKVPVGAAVLIGLGVLFLLNTVLDFSLHRFWPLILIFLGVWLFAKHWGLLGTYRPACVCERCRTRKLLGPSILVTLGVLFLLENVSDVGFGKTWPALLLVIGVVKLMQSNASSDGHVGMFPPGTYPNIPPTAPPNAPPPQATQPPTSSSSNSGEVNNV
jgi:cell wall-active antibiotic response 4TMS protein YvqF/B-box zinc finger protein